MGYFFLIAGAVAVFLAVLLLRAVCFRPKTQPSADAEPISLDQKRAVRSLQALVRCKTVSCAHGPEDDAEFEKLLRLLPELYPLVFKNCQVQQFPERGLLLRWKGKSSNSPTVMMAHYDVVPADEGQWQKAAFGGIIENGFLWGRGTLDTKVTVNGILCAAEHLIAEGFCPDQDCYFAFSGSEEINGNGAKNIVDYFQAQGIRPGLVLDEGGAVVENVFPGVKSPCALIGIAEKGMMNVEYAVASNGGHASAPPVDSPVSLLAEACLQVLKHPFRMRLHGPAAQLFDTLGRHSTFLYRLIFANLWCFRPVLDRICKHRGGEMNALVRTTTAFTQMEGSNARNVLPTQAKLVSNMRLAPGDTVEEAKKHLENAVSDDQVTVRVLEAFEASPVSQTQCDAYRLLSETVVQSWPGVIVSPYLMVQCADARHYGTISDRVYRFCPMALTTEERQTIHGNDERIRLDAICKCVEFYIRLMKQC